MIPAALAMLHLANLIEFSTAKDGFMWAEEGFYVYSQSGLGDPSKVCRLQFNSEEEGSEDEQEEKLSFITPSYLVCNLKAPSRASGFYRRTNLWKHGKSVYLNDEGTSLKSQFSYL